MSNISPNYGCFLFLLQQRHFLYERVSENFKRRWHSEEGTNAPVEEKTQEKNSEEGIQQENITMENLGNAIPKNRRNVRERQQCAKRWQQK